MYANRVPKTLAAQPHQSSQSFFAPLPQSRLPIQSKQLVQRQEVPTQSTVAVRAAGLPSALSQTITQLIEQRQYQAAIDAVVTHLVSTGEINSALLLNGGMRYAPTLSDDGWTPIPGYDASGQANPADVSIGNSAFTEGVSKLFSTILHEYRHVLQLSQPDNSDDNYAGTGGQLDATHAPAGETGTERQRRLGRTRRLISRQEFEAYAYELINAARTGISFRQMVLAYGEVVRRWRGFNETERAGLRSLYDQSTEIYQRARAVHLRR
jgi:hypothetical protein